MRGDRLGELGAVEHREVGALSGRRRQMRGVAEQRHTGHALPSVSGRERVEHAQDRRVSPSVISAVSVRRPALELGRDPRLRRDRVGEVDAGEPLGRAVQRDIGVQDAARLAVGEDPLSRREGEQGAAADRLGRWQGAARRRRSR